MEKPVSGRKRPAFPGKGQMTQEQEEPFRLRMEHEILKKAAAFFAKESL